MRRAVALMQTNDQPRRSMAHYDSGAVYGTFFYDEPDLPPRKKKMVKVKLQLDKKTDAELLAFANAHKAAGTGNANFATPIPAAAVFDTLTTNFDTSLMDLAAARTVLARAVAAKEAGAGRSGTRTEPTGGSVDAQSGGAFRVRAVGAAGTGP